MTCLSLHHSEMKRLLTHTCSVRSQNVIVLSDRQWPCSFTLPSWECMSACSVMTYSRDPMDPTWLLCPWDFPGKSTGVGCHFLLQGSSQPRDGTQSSCVSCIAGRFFTTWATQNDDFPWWIFSPWYPGISNRNRIPDGSKILWEDRDCQRKTKPIIAFLK